MKSTTLIPIASLLASLALTLPGDAQRGGGHGGFTGGFSGGSFSGGRSSPGRVSSPSPARPSTFRPSSTRAGAAGYRPTPLSSGQSRTATTPSRPVYVPAVSSAPQSSSQGRGLSQPTGRSLGSPSSSKPSTSAGKGAWGPNRVMDSSALPAPSDAARTDTASGGAARVQRRVRFPASYGSAVYGRREAENERLRQLAGDSSARGAAGAATAANLTSTPPAFTQASLQRIYARGQLPAVDTARDAYGRGPVDRLAAPDTTLERIASGRSASAARADELVTSTATPQAAGGLTRVVSPIAGTTAAWRAFQGPNDPILEVTPPGAIWAWGVTWSYAACWAYSSPAHPWSWCYSWPLWWCAWWAQPVVPVYLPGYGYGYGYGYGGTSIYTDASYGGGAIAMEVEEAVLADGEGAVGEGVAEQAFDAEADAAARMAGAERYLTLGDRAFREERYQDAVQFYSKAVDLVPEEGVLHMILADALFATGDYHWAAAQIRRALDLDPNLVDSALDKYGFYLDPTEFDRQLVTLELYVRDHPTDTDARLVLGLNYLFGQRLGGVLELLEGENSFGLRSDPAAVLIKAAAGRA